MTESATFLKDGISALRGVLKLNEVMRLIEHTARWVDPETFRLLPVWYPEHARGTYFYKANWSEPQWNTNRQTGVKVHKREGNLHANKALTHALGLRSKDRPNWSCCHIWGLDDPMFQKGNSIVQDRRYFSCVANMVLLPTPLKAFTDSMPEVKMMLRVCAANLYGWICESDDVGETAAAVRAWNDWSVYPASWPREAGATEPLGVRPLSSRIKHDAQKRVERIRHDLQNAGEFYPREQVQDTLEFWEVKL